MEYLNSALAVLGRVWTYVWSKISAISNAVYDPPPRTVKVYFFGFLALFVGSIVVWSLGVKWVNNKLASMVGLSSDVQPLLSAPVDATKPAPMPGVRLELPKPLPVPPVKVEAKADAKSKPSKKAEAPKASKRKAKKQAATSDPWQF